MADEKVDPLKQAFDFFLNKPAADPAQSAPSAEPREHEELALARKWANENGFSFYTWKEALVNALKTYAALRTAQHEANARTWEANSDEWRRQCLAAEARAETAESALRQIVGNVDLKQLLGWLDFELSGSPGDGMLSDCKEIISRVAAQTPQVSNKKGK